MWPETRQEFHVDVFRRKQISGAGNYDSTLKCERKDFVARFKSPIEEDEMSLI